MEMKLLTAALVLTLFGAPCFAQSAAPPPQATDIDEAMASWMRQKAEQSIIDGQARRATGAGQSKGLLEIRSLADYPAPSAIKQNIAAGIRARSHGPLQVADGAIPSVSSLISTHRSVVRTGAELRQRLSSAPADLSHTALGQAELLSTEPTGTLSAGRSTGLVRLYRLGQGGIIVFSEDDYIASGTKITLIRETLNTDVNGVPARAYAARSNDGRAKAELRWVTPTRSFWLTLITDDGARIESGEKLLMQIANGIGP